LAPYIADFFNNLAARPRGEALKPVVNTLHMADCPSASQEGLALCVRGPWLRGIGGSIERSAAQDAIGQHIGYLPGGDGADDGRGGCRAPSPEGDLPRRAAIRAGVKVIPMGQILRIWRL
jgi:hypothetical protein